MSVQETILAEKSKKIEDKLNQLKTDFEVIKQENELLSKSN